MDQPTSFQLGLLYLTHLIISADDVVDDDELNALKKICDTEGIPGKIFNKVRGDLESLSEKEIYLSGLASLEACSDEDRMKVFVWLYKMSAADGNVHAKEIRFLLYSLRKAGIEFDDVVKAAKSYPPIFE